MKTDRVIFWLLFTTISILVVYPLGNLFLGSFLSETGGMTLKHWRTAFETHLLWISIRNTLLTSTIATCVAILIGLYLVIVIARTDAPFRNLLKLVTLVPFITPPIVGGVAWGMLADPSGGVLNILLQKIGLNATLNIYSWGGMILVMGLYTAPIVYFICASGLAGIDTSNEESARTCGAGRFRILFEITLPLLLPSIASAGLLVFMTNNVLFGVHSVIGIPANIPVLTTTIYSVLAFIPINYYHAAVLSIMLLSLGVVAALANQFIVGKRSYYTVSGKGFRPMVVIRLGMWKWVIGVLTLTYVFLTVILPYGVILLRSFSSLALWQGGSLKQMLSDVSLQGYTYILIENSTAKRAIFNSLFLGTVSAIGAALLAFMAAYFNVKKGGRAENILEFITMTPLAVPGIVFGVALLWTYSSPPLVLYGTLTILFLGYLTHQLPTAFRACYGNLKGIHPELDESARVCGAGWFYRISEITLQLARPGIMVAALLVFITVLRELGTSVILFSHGTEVLASLMFNFWEEGLMQHVSSLAMLNVIIVIAVLWIMNKVMREPLDRMTG
ncbi:MAG: iron ABC transporter permease [Deltaproteobacteria bacterium]|nr:iron ABC transporter permease [Deltaproteobacteria bacterium]